MSLGSLAALKSGKSSFRVCVQRLLRLLRLPELFTEHSIVCPQAGKWAGNWLGVCEQLSISGGTWRDSVEWRLEGFRQENVFTNFCLLEITGHKTA